MAIPEEFLTQLRANNDIVDIMTPYVNFKRAGRDSVCLCPFHSEKTPSCHIYTDTQSFYCFGCGAGGDVITFIRLIENLDYIEAVKLLSEKAGMVFPDNNSDDKSAYEKTRLLEINREAARFFRDYLLSDEGKAGLDYLYGRGLTPNTIKKYGLGYAPNDWHKLKMHMRSKNYDDDELVSASILVRNQNNTYDKFRNRVMFPIIDRRGNVIAFGGRVINPEDSPKYLNSSETPVFQKRNNLYSLNFAKNTKASYFILCEGNLDVISLNQAGFDSAVATLGTAITSEQARLVRQYVDEVIIAYDADSAGQVATIKAINLFSDAGISAKVLTLPDAKDPDEYLKKYGKEAFSELLTHSGSAISFELLKIQKSVNIDTPEGRAEYLAKAVKLLSEINNRLDRTIYISDVARLCEITPQAVEQSIDYQIKRKAKYQQQNETKKLINEPIMARSEIQLYPDEQKNPPEARAERGIIAFVIHSPDKLPQILQKLTPDDFPTLFNKRLFETLMLRISTGRETDLIALGSEFSAEEMGRIKGIEQEGVLLPFTNERLNDYIKILNKFKSQKGGKSPADMTIEELAEYRDKLLREKTKEK